jgi:hypothetical protein
MFPRRTSLTFAAAPRLFHRLGTGHSVRSSDPGYGIGTARRPVRPAHGDRQRNGRVIYAFHATNTGVRTWGRDLLGSSVIPPGQTWTFNFDDSTGYCMFDFKAVLDNGRAIERYRVNVCEFVTWTVR